MSSSSVLSSESLRRILQDKSAEQIEVLLRAVLPSHYAQHKSRYVLSKRTVDWNLITSPSVKKHHIALYVAQSFYEGITLPPLSADMLSQAFLAPEHESWFHIPQLVGQDDPARIDVILWDSWTSLVAELDTLLEQTPSNPVLRHNLSVLRIMLGDVFSAYQHINLLLTADPTNVRFLSTLLYILVATQEMPLAFSVVLSLLKIVYRKMCYLAADPNADIVSYSTEFMDEIFVLTARLLHLSNPSIVSSQMESPPNSDPSLLTSVSSSSSSSSSAPSSASSSSVDDNVTVTARRRIAKLMETLQSNLRQITSSSPLLSSLLTRPQELTAAQWPSALIRFAVRGEIKYAWNELVTVDAADLTAVSDVVKQWDTQEWVRQIGKELKIRYEKLTAASSLTTSTLPSTGASSLTSASTKPSSLVPWNVLALLSASEKSPSLAAIFSFLGVAVVLRSWSALWTAQREQRAMIESAPHNLMFESPESLDSSTRRFQAVQSRVRRTLKGPSIADVSSSDEDEQPRSHSSRAPLSDSQSSSGPQNRVAKMSFERLQKRITEFAPYKLDAATRDKLIPIQDFYARSQAAEAVAEREQQSGFGARNRGGSGSFMGDRFSSFMQQPLNSASTRTSASASASSAAPSVLSDSRMASSAFFRQFGALSGGGAVMPRASSPTGSGSSGNMSRLRGLRS